MNCLLEGQSAESGGDVNNTNQNIPLTPQSKGELLNCEFRQRFQPKSK